jgi:uncharacterized protein
MVVHLQRSEGSPSREAAHARSRNELPQGCPKRLNAQRLNTRNPPMHRRQIVTAALTLAFTRIAMPALAATPVFERPTGATFAFRGPMGERIDRNVHNWLLWAPDANPSMLRIFRDRDNQPPRDLLPWSGEFAGKYLISAVQAVRMTKDRALKARTSRFVAELIATQRADGYLGPFPKAENMVGPGRWDLWGQYHVMLGLLLWHEDTGDKAAVAACRKCADHFCNTFLDTGKRVVQAGSEEMNESSSHVFTLLYERTREPRYLRMAHEIERDWETPPSGDYVRESVAGKPYWQTPKPRWEGLHSVQAISELYFITGDEKYRKAFEQIWWTICEGDRHNTGGFSSGEQATGNPYNQGAIETCCTIAWMCITVDMLRMTGDARVADELELSTWNGVLGAQHPSGRWWTYNTPMDGERKASAHDIVFQARPGSPELNCCSVNAPRGLGMLSEWAVMNASDGLALNYYGPSTFTVRLAGGNRVTLDQDTRFPADGKVRITVRPSRPGRFTLRLRIPGWSRKTTVTVAGKAMPDPQPATYLVIEREWHDGDAIDLQLDMTPRLWVGEKELAGKASLYVGPLLLAYDARFDVYTHSALPDIDLGAAPVPVTPADGAGPLPIVLYRFPVEAGKTITLCDFASAGAAGNPYVSWLHGKNRAPVPFSRENPLRMAR